MKNRQRKCGIMPETSLKKNARKLLFENAPKIFIISVIYVTVSALISGLAFSLPGTFSLMMVNEQLLAGELPDMDLLLADIRPVGVILMILLVWSQPVVVVGFIRYYLNIKREQDGDYKDLLDGFNFFLKIILIRFLTNLFISLWSMLFLFPGIVASYRYRQAFYILLDDPGKSVLQCINESKQMMYGRKLDLLILDLSFIGWYILDILVIYMIPVPFAVPVVSIWISPYVGLTRAAFYDELIAGVAV